MDGYYARSPRVASRVLDGEAVLVKMPESVLHVLNRSASRIWVRADGVRSGAEVASGLDPAASGAFLEKMVELGLMERAERPRDEPQPFPQEVELPPSTEPPAISVSEAVEVLAGGSCLLLDIMFCDPLPSVP